MPPFQRRKRRGDAEASNVRATASSDASGAPAQAPAFAPPPPPPPPPTGLPSSALPPPVGLPTSAAPAPLDLPDALDTAAEAEVRADGAPDADTPTPQPPTHDASVTPARSAAVPGADEAAASEEAPSEETTLVDTDETAADAETSADADGEPHWTRPGAADDVSVHDGRYRGRSLVGEPGGMLRVQPSVLNKLSGSFVPDSVVDAGVVSDSVSVGAVSVKGASHHHSATPRQDAYAIGSDADWVVIAIADGVSEGKLSHVAATEAARVTVSETLKALASATPADISWSAVGVKAKDAVRALGLRRARQQVGPDGTVPEISDRTIARIMATTCDVLITPTARRNGSLRVWRVRISGDGSFYVLDPARGWALLDAGKDSSSSAVDNSVGDPLPIGGEHPDVESWELRPGQAIVLCTDGFGDVIAEGARPVGRYLFDAWQQPLDTTQLLFTSSFVNVNADDDRTAAIVWATA